MKNFALALCLLAALACARPTVPQPVQTQTPILPQFQPLAALYDELQGFRDDRLYLRHGFTANFPHADWLERVQRLESDPQLAESADLLANLAIAYRIHGAKSRVTADFETRFDRSMRPAAPPAPATPLLATQPEPGPAMGMEPMTVMETQLPDESDTPLQPQPAGLPAALSTTQVQVQPEAQTPPPAMTRNPEQTVPVSRGQSEVQPVTQDGAEIPPLPGPPVQPKPETQAPQRAEAHDPQTQPAPPGQAQALSPATTPAAGTVALIFSGDTQGVLYPQPGISGPVGGIARRAPVIDHVRAEEQGAILVDAGDAFASGFARADKINKILVRAMNRMGYEAMGLGRHDMAMGEVALRELVSIASFPMICTNLEFRQGVTPWIRDHVLLERAGVRVGVISLLAMDTGARFTGAAVIPPDQALRVMLPKLRAKTDCVVLLTQIDSAEISALLQANPGVTAVIGDCRATSMDSPLYVPAVPKGLGVGLLRLTRSDNGYIHPVQTLPLLTGEKEAPALARMLDDLKE